MKILKTAKKSIDWLLLVSSLTLLTIMVIAIIYQVFARQVLHDTPAWATPLANLLFVWVSFLGIAYGFKERLHIGVGLIVNIFPEKIQDIIDYATKILIIGFGLLMMYYGWLFTTLMGGSGISGLGVPSSFLYAAVPVSGFFVTFYGVELLFKKGLHQTMDEVSEE
ncbi:hypothetical protein Plano_1720 [Planococcus sp. PAMC 21323]|uniref:TRAP transporter small permease n=1 Tax=Planococcus sp. PAMC 21323 TaxID=1526927 RepID=UPI00056E4ED5|nr:TRAP transporter small permease [Planococcus sp. PAMC 21323]AIY05685.1 hypothetical protein Plano_1720 [Planococcus sp. PAMC 21323]